MGLLTYNTKVGGNTLTLYFFFVCNNNHQIAETFSSHPSVMVRADTTSLAPLKG